MSQSLSVKPSIALENSTPGTIQNRQLIEEIRHNDELFALIISADFREPGIHFFTPNSLSQQLAYMHHPQGKVIAPHIHNSVPRQVEYTQEVLLIRRGKVRVDFYTEQQEYLKGFFAGVEARRGDDVATTPSVRL